MQYIFVVISFLGGLAGMIGVKSLELNTGLTAALVVPLVILIIYSMARLKPEEPKAEPRVTG